MKFKYSASKYPDDEQEGKPIPKSSVPKRKINVSLTLGSSGRKNVEVEVDYDKEPTADDLINEAIKVMRNSPDVQTQSFADSVSQRYMERGTVVERIDNDQFFPISRYQSLPLIENSVSFSLAVDHVGG